MVSSEMADAIARQMAHAKASHQVDRRGWTDEQWIEDAIRLMGDLEGSVLDLLNGHVMALIKAVEAARKIRIHHVSADKVIHTAHRGACDALCGNPTDPNVPDLGNGWCEWCYEFDHSPMMRGSLQALDPLGRAHGSILTLTPARSASPTVARNDQVGESE